jgi:predicted metalloendopeptidase
VSRRDPDNVYHRMDAGQLAKIAPGFDWNLYFAKTEAPASAWLNVVSTGFATGFSTLLGSQPLADWKVYLRWHAAASAAGWLSSDFVAENFDFGGRKLTGAKELKPRWKRCVELTDGALGHDLGRRYVDLTFGPEGKTRTNELIVALRDSLRSDLKSLDWMTAQTRKRALEKLASTTDKIGFPDKWRDYEGVKISSSDLIGSLRSARAYETRRELNKIGKPVDRKEWDMTPPTVNAYYNPQLNEIVFPAGILQSPFFDKDGDQAFNLGAIGVVIGHEMTHGFDDEGRKFDGQGNLKDWWTPLPGVKLNGRLTLGENTADNGGVRLATMALGELEKGGKVPADVNGFTPEQRLYLGFAQVWCQNSTEESKRMLAQVDPHSDAHSRVIGPLSNTAGFGKAFSCKVGDPMMPVKTCRVW